MTNKLLNNSTCACSQRK